MHDFVPVGILFLVMVVTTTRIILAVADWPVTTGRFWPWLRLRSWWPVPADHAAETLLRSMLTVPEYRQFCACAYLEVPSMSYPGRMYRIPRGPGQVMVIERGRIVERLCLQPAQVLPEADVVLLHKLLIEADERTYLATANHFPRSVWV